VHSDGGADASSAVESLTVSTPKLSADAYPIRARMVLRIPRLWVITLLVASIMVGLITAFYIASVVDPISHLRDLPIVVVNEDNGAMIGAQHLNIGHEVQTGLTTSHVVSSHLQILTSGMNVAKQTMDDNNAYATVVIPPKFTVALLTVSGVPVPRPTSTRPQIGILTNDRSGTVGVGLATGFLQPALDVASKQIGKELLAHVPADASTPATRAILTDPVDVTTTPYRPLPAHSGLGLSAFYIALLALTCGFLVGTIVHNGADSGLGYATTETGPRWHQSQPLPINRWQTLLVKWAVVVVLAAVVSGVILAVAAGALRMDAPNLTLLWLFMWLCSVSVAVGTIVLFAVVGSYGQLLALLIFVYLGLASAGGTVPVQALPGPLRYISSVDPLREILAGTRSILYFDARADTGLAGGVLAAALGLVFWLVLGTAVVRWYDRRGFERLSPELLTYIGESIAQYRAKQPVTLATSDGAPPARSGDTAAPQPAAPPIEPTPDESSGDTS
jgi:YhgE/Pip-like protein